MCFKVKELILSMHLRADALAAANFEDHSTEVIALIEEETEGGELEIVRYIASFFTYKNMFTLSDQHQKNGSFLRGLYFYSKNMVMIRSCTPGNIAKVVDHLIEDGGFREVFQKIS